jgi:hypothetical protein
MTAAFLLSQVSPEEEPVIENFINYRMGGRTEGFFRDPKSGSAVAIRPGSRIDRLLSGCDDNTFFQPRNLQSTAGSRTDSGKTVTGGPPDTVGARINMQLATPQQRKKELQNFQKASEASNVFAGAAGQAAAGAPVLQGQVKSGTIEGFNGGARMGAYDQAVAHHGDGRKMQGEVWATSPAGCGPQGTIFEYGGQRLMGANFQFPPGKSALLQPAEGLTDTLPVGNMSVPGPDGGPQDVQIADRLIYSTLSRKRCAGTVDMIRGDLPIPKGGQYSAPAGNPADTLESGAFAAMFGLDARSAQQTTALILESQAGTRPTLAGADIAELTEEAARLGQTPTVLNIGSTATGAAQEILNNEGAGVNSRRIGVNAASGGAQVFSGLAG